MQALHTADHQAVGTRPLDLRPHGHQHLGQVHHLGLARGVLQNGLALGQTGRHHQVLGARHRHHVGHDASALQPCGTRHHEALLDLDLRAHRLQALDVLIDRPLANGTAPGQRHAGLTEARQERPQHQDGRAHRLDQLIGRLGADQTVGLQRQTLLVTLGLHPQQLQQPDGGGDVLQLRHVGQFHRIRRQQAGAQDGQRRILGAGGLNLAHQGQPPQDFQLVHDDRPLTVPAGPAIRPASVP